MVREVGHPHGVGSSHELLPLSGEHKGIAGGVGFLPRIMEHLRGHLQRIQKTREKSKSPNLGRHVEKQVPLTAKPRANIPFLPAFTITHLKILQNNNIPALVPVCFARKSDA